MALISTNTKAKQIKKANALRWDVEVNPRKPWNHARLSLAPSPPFQQQSEEDEHKAQNEEGRGDHKEENTDVRTRSNGDEVYKE
jgi:hypothetical protein